VFSKNNKTTPTYLLNTEFKSGEIVVKPSQNRLYIGGHEKILQPKVLDLLTLLCAAQGETLSKSHLVNALWPNTIVGPDSLANTMARLRKALNDDAKNAQYIETVQRKGYRWLKPITIVTSRPSNKNYMKSGLAVAVLLISGAAFHIFSPEKTPTFPYTDLYVLPLPDGGFEVKVGFDGELTQAREIAMLEEVKRITGQANTDMEFSIDDVNNNCGQQDNNIKVKCLTTPAKNN